MKIFCQFFDNASLWDGRAIVPLSPCHGATDKKAIMLLLYT